jgi:subtilase family serine protease
MPLSNKLDLFIQSEGGFNYNNQRHQFLTQKAIKDLAVGEEAVVEVRSADHIMVLLTLDYEVVLQTKGDKKYYVYENHAIIKRKA